MDVENEVHRLREAEKARQAALNVAKERVYEALRLREQAEKDYWDLRESSQEKRQDDNSVANDRQSGVSRCNPSAVGHPDVMTATTHKTSSLGNNQQLSPPYPGNIREFWGGSTNLTTVWKFWGASNPSSFYSRCGFRTTQHIREHGAISSAVSG